VKKNKLNVFITVDTEVWEFYNDIEKNVSSSLWGITEQGEYGLNFQLEKLEQYNLQATFFLEPFFSYHSGTKPLETAINQISAFNQEIGLHIHTEWINGAKNFPYQLEHIHRNIGDFDLATQEKLISHAKHLITGVKNVNICCFRAGNYGADNQTLKALHSLDIAYDTSYNVPYLKAPCNIQVNTLLTSPSVINNTTEIPVSHFYDYPNHRRHLQLSACSFSELKDVLLSNWTAQQFSCVIVLHSFEWIKRDKKNNKHYLDKICLKRFENLCQFLADNTDKFQTSHFENIKANEAMTTQPQHVAKSKIHSTVLRYIEQLLRRS
jgi:hypothetical protein